MCGNACSENLECDHLTWTRIDNMCYLKKGQWPGNTPTPYPDAKCGYLPGRGSWKASGNFLWDDNCDFYGNPLQKGVSQFPTVSTTECANACLANAECDHFTWYGVNKNCYLKQGQWPGNNANLLTNAQCGFIPGRPWKVEATFLWANNCDFGGQDLPDPSTKSNIQECGNACFDKPECDHFSWDSLNKKCFLKKGQWPDNSPAPHAYVQCGFIPGRAWVTSGKIVWGDGCDFSGQDINNEPDIYEWKAMFGPSVKYGKKPPKTKKEDCGTSCLENPKCDHFSWEPSTTNCYHKIWSGKGPTIKNGGRCGYIPDRIHIEPVMLKDKDAWDVTHPVIRWQDYCYFPDGKCLNCQHQGTSTIWIPKEKCGQECLENPKCSRFNWDGREFDRDGVSARCFHLEWSDSLARPKGSARCGFISDRQSARKISWTTNDKIVSASNCDAPESATTIDVIDVERGLVECGEKCITRKGTKCTAFVLSGTSCRMYNVAIPEKWLIPDDFRSCGFIKSA